jgi:hypothetical protein
MVRVNIHLPSSLVTAPRVPTLLAILAAIAPSMDSDIAGHLRHVGGHERHADRGDRGARPIAA